MEDRKLEEEIRSRAWDRYEFRCEYNIPGDALEDWLAAEKEILWWYNPNKQKHANQFPAKYIKLGE